MIDTKLLFKIIKWQGKRKVTSTEYALPRRKLTMRAANNGGDWNLIPIPKLCKYIRY